MGTMDSMEYLRAYGEDSSDSEDDKDTPAEKETKKEEGKNDGATGSFLLATPDEERSSKSAFILPRAVVDFNMRRLCDLPGANAKAAGDVDTWKVRGLDDIKKDPNKPFKLIDERKAGAVALGAGEMEKGGHPEAAKKK